MNNRGDFGFVWLFAIFAGAAILILAIYGTVKLTNTQDLISDSEIAKQLTILTDPMEAGFAQTITANLKFSGQTRIMNECDDIKFGHNYLSISTLNRKKWSEYGIATGTADKYMFSESVIEGDELNIISEKFSYPFKVSDILIMVSAENNYCFNDAPEEIKSTIDAWRIDSFKTEGCESDPLATQVCFETSSCDITIYGGCTDCDSKYEYGTIVDSRSTRKYVEGLMFAALFSDSENYNCNVKRLMYRTSKISQIFIDRIPLTSMRDCSSNLASDLNTFKSMTGTATTSDLLNLKVMADKLDARASLEVCRPW